MHFRHAKTCDLGAFLGESHVTFPHGAQGITCETWYVLSICDHQKMKWLCISLREWVIALHCQWGIRGELRCEWIIYSSFGILSRKKWHFSLTSTHFFTVTVLQYSKASRSNERLFTSFLTCFFDPSFEPWANFILLHHSNNSFSCLISQKVVTILRSG